MVRAREKLFCAMPLFSERFIQFFAQFDTKFLTGGLSEGLARGGMQGGSRGPQRVWRRRSAFLSAGAFFLLFFVLFRTAGAADLENQLYLEVESGRVVIDLRPDLAPRHVERIKQLAREGFYDGVPFHRVIDGFMAQTGDPTGTGSGGSGQKLKAEFSDARHVRGVVSMARAQDPDSADSQFFILFEAAPWLDGSYTVVGKVVSGMERVDGLKRGTGPNGLVVNPDRVLSIRVALDVESGSGAN